MCGVRDDNVGVRNLFQHSPTGQFLLKLANPALDLRSSFGVLQFIENFLARHTQTFFVVPDLKRHVYECDQAERCAADEEHRDDHTAGCRHCGTDIRDAKGENCGNHRIHDADRAR